MSYPQRTVVIVERGPFAGLVAPIQNEKKRALANNRIAALGSEAGVVGKPDELAQKILDAIGIIEKALRPALEGTNVVSDLTDVKKSQPPTGYRRRSKSSHSSFASMN